MAAIFISDHRSLEYIIIFFSTAFGGEPVLFIFAFLAAQKVISTFLYYFQFSGNIFFQYFMVFLGKTNIVNRMIICIVMPMLLFQLLMRQWAGSVKGVI